MKAAMRPAWQLQIFKNARQGSFCQAVQSPGCLLRNQQMMAERADAEPGLAAGIAHRDAVSAPLLFYRRFANAVPRMTTNSSRKPSTCGVMTLLRCRII